MKHFTGQRSLNKKYFPDHLVYEKERRYHMEEINEALGDRW
jgi:predicted phosphatase